VRIRKRGEEIVENEDLAESAELELHSAVLSIEFVSAVLSTIRTR